MKGDRAVYAILKADSTITSITSNIFRNLRKEGTGFPAIEIEQDNVETSPIKNGVSKLDICDVTVYVYYQAGNNSDALIDAIRTSLDRKSGTYESIVVQSIDFERMSNYADEVDNLPVIVTEMEYRVRIVR